MPHASKSAAKWLLLCVCVLTAAAQHSYPAAGRGQVAGRLNHAGGSGADIGKAMYSSELDLNAPNYGYAYGGNDLYPKGHNYNMAPQHEQFMGMETEIVYGPVGVVQKPIMVAEPQPRVIVEHHVEKELVEVPVYVKEVVEVPVVETQIVEKPVYVPYEVEVPVYVDKPYKVEVEKPEDTTERKVSLPLMRRTEIPQSQTIIDTIIEPAPPVPVIVKTVHDTTVVTEEPTDIHHIELKKEKKEVKKAPPPIRATARAAAPPVEESSGFCGWWCWLLLCCLLPLCLLPLLCCRSKKKYTPGPIAKPYASEAVDKKNLVAVPERKRAVVRRVEEPQEDIEVEIEKEIEKMAIVEETVVVRKEVPLGEYEHQV